MLNYSKGLIVLLILLCSRIAVSQILFPNGNSKSLECIDDMEYTRTAINFQVTKGKITDYSYKVLISQIQPEWGIDACINGECRFGVPDSLPIYQFAGQPDTTGFIMFHVFHNQTPGQSFLCLKLFSRIWPDTATLYYHFYHLGKSLNVSNPLNKPSMVFPNPVNSYLSIDLKDGAFFSLQNAVGEIVLEGRVTNEIDTKGLPAGIYYLNLKQNNNSNQMHKIIIQH